MGYLYIFQEDRNDFYKVGISKNYPDLRKAQLQTGNPRPLKKVKYYRLNNYKYLESRVHSKLKRYQTAGGTEWFQCDKATVIKTIEDELEGKQTMLQRIADFIAYLWTLLLGLFVLFLIVLIVDSLFLNGVVIGKVLDLFFY